MSQRSSSSLFLLSITQQTVGTELTESVQQMVCCYLCGRPLAGHSTAPPFSSFLRSLLLFSYTSSNTHTHTPSSISSAQPGHLLPSLQRPSHTENAISHGTWHIQGGHTYGTITCTDSLLFACHASTNIKMTRNFIDILTCTFHLAPTRSASVYYKRRFGYSSAAFLTRSASQYTYNLHQIGNI